MRVNVKRKGASFQMIAENESGNTINMDAAENIGGENTGFRPMQLLLAAIGGCSAIDVLLILKKQKQQLDTFEVEVEGDKVPVEEHSIFREIVLHFKASGSADPVKVEKAIKLSLEKYCSVSKTLEPTAKISFKLSFNS